MKHLFRKTTALLLTLCMIIGMTGLPITAYAEGLDSGGGGAAIVAADKAALEIGFSVTDSVYGVTANLTLPLTGVSGSAITWLSDTPEIIANDGAVTRPAADAEDAEVTLTATITSGEASDTKEFTVTVLKESGLEILLGPMSTVVWEGNGDADSPYEVSSAGHLDEIRTKGMDAHYIQTDNIDLTGINWTPIGTGSFSGTYDGLGHTISNLTIDNSTLQYVGLFSRIENEGVLRNIQLANIEITALELEDEENAGALAGSSSGSITGCSSTGTISCALNPSYYIGASIGGLVGRNGGTLEDSYSAVEVDVEAAGFLDILIGGLAGFNDGEIVRSYSSGSVTVSATAVNPGRYVNVGGLVGINDDSLLNCYSISDVTVDSAVDATSAAAGALAGMNYEDITNCYSTGLVSATGGATAGGLIGSGSATVNYSYYLDTAGTSAGGTPLTEAQMKQWGSFEGWDFDAVWKIGQNISYPILQWQEPWTTDEEITADLIALDWTDIQGTNGAENDVTSALALVGTGTRGSTITWSASPSGYINISNGTLSKPYTDEVAVTLAATVSKGSGTPQTKTFSLTVKPLTPDEAITLDKDTLIWAVIKGTNSAENHVTADLELPDTGTSGTTAITWSADPAGYIDISDGKVTLPADGNKTVTLTAAISRVDGTPQTVDFTLVIKAKSSSGGGSSGGSAPVTPTYKAEVKAGNSTGTTLPVTVDKAAGTASVDAGSRGFAQAGTVITIPSIPNIDTYTAGVPVPELSTSGMQGTLTVNTGNGSVTVPSNMLTGVSGVSGNKAEISIGRGDKDRLPADVKAAIGDRPLISLTLSIDGQQTNWSNPDTPVTVSIPYTPNAEELANPAGITVWYIDGSGNVVELPGARYDPGTKAVVFSVTHFSLFAVIYNTDAAAARKVIRLTTGSSAAEINGASYTLDAAPYVDTAANRTLVPLRFISEALGAQVTWLADSKQVVIKDGAAELILTIGSQTVLVNGAARATDSAPATLPPGRVFVPLRFIAETLSATVDYDQDTKQITLTR